MSERDDDGDDDDGSPRVTREELRSFLARPETLQRAASIIGARSRPDHVSDLVQDAMTDALTATELPRATKVQAWFDRCCRNAAARAYRKQARRAKYEGPMPAAHGADADAHEGLEHAGDAEPRVETAYARVAPDWHAEGWLLRLWMRDQVAADPKERETWAIMEELAEAPAEQRLTYRILAERHGVTEAQLYKRMERLREKYRDRYRQWRHRMLLALLKWGAGLAVACVAVAWVLWKLLQPPQAAPDSRRDPAEFAPVPSATASGAPFEQSLSAQPPAPPAPPAPPTSNKAPIR